MRPFASLSRAVVAILLASLIGGCTDEPPEERAEPTGAESVQLASWDGFSLHARLWDRGPARLVIYLHEFREDQSAWWPHAEVARNPVASAMTLDFRGHGESAGEHVDVEGMVHDVVAAITYARERGFERVMLVGAGMGAAVAIIAAVEVHNVTVVGLSTPADFDVLDTLAVVELIADRVQLIAMRDDISAADSLRRFRDLPNVDSTMARLYPGSSHGVAILEDPASSDLRARFEGLLEEFWVAPD